MKGVRAARSFRVRYVVGLCAIALLVTASYLTVQEVVSEQRNYSTLVNLAGHQGGLANRIAYFASRMATTDEETEFSTARAQVGRTIYKMEEAHRILREGAPERGIPRVSSAILRMIYEDPTVGLDRALERFLERARTVYEMDMARLDTGTFAYIFLTTYGPHVLEPMFDAAVEEYERIGLAATLRIENLELVIWIAALCTLLLEAALIFLPLERRIHQSIASLERSVEELTATKERLVRAQRLAMVGDWQWDLGEDTLVWSNEVFRICGVAPETFSPTPQSTLQCVHPDDRGRVRSALEETRSRAATVCFEHRVVHPDGTLRLVYQQTVPQHDASGRVVSVSGTIQDITDRKRKEEQIRELAMFDPLTGLANRRLLKDRLEHALAAARPRSDCGAILMLDLDNFKTLNDTQGHDVGDALLFEVGERLRGSLRDTDTVARLGGDEFVVVIERLGQDEDTARPLAMEIAEKIRSAVNRPYVLGDETRTHRTSASIGIAMFRGAQFGVDELLKQADVAMFEAKDSGRNRACFFREQRQAIINSRSALVDALRHAVENRELRLFYQPQFSTAGTLVGAEALLRWLPPGRDPVAPDDFIPLAEQSDLILPIGEWVLETACRDLMTLDRHHPRPRLAVAVNVSARQFSDTEFSEKVRTTIARAGVDPRRLKLELTESFLVQDLERAAGILSELRRMGLRIELDDFGTGYSSLTSLKQLPLDTLKLDRSLVRDIAADGIGSAIARAATAVAKALGLSIVAEGVETVQQREFLIREGCDTLQGLLFAKPMPLDSLIHRYLAEGRSSTEVIDFPRHRPADPRYGEPRRPLDQPR
jgi:diguanylate cyclase (GGDEF)-like protein/PAS domain S-box-containing protein